MRARTERAAAHAALKQAQKMRARVGVGVETTPAYQDLLRTALMFTQPRPWWRFW